MSDRRRSSGSSEDEAHAPDYPSFDPVAVKLARKQWKRVVQLVPNWHEVFFSYLFERAPYARTLFPFDVDRLQGNSSLAEHAKRVGQALETALQGLFEYYSLVEVLEKLGRRHFKYGVEPEHIDLFEETFYKTLAIGLGKKWNPEARRAWEIVCGLILSPIRTGILQARTKANHLRAKEAERKRQLEMAAARLEGRVASSGVQFSSDTERSRRSTAASATATPHCGLKSNRFSSNSLRKTIL
ncbi:uncharacterized protein MONBRDRAFT_31962 [Monosiga brevicollis MX1]|uniref:Globin domain-containing protein n=1 Tax=Monosiga brevicollis TaxID=81824 RepID=A9UWH7_MONBE|nr:uncharacterized protein MONBRDRAFT_31962 [Monosiga brevicollis MX1]EDQ90046.1 predicted protein [Monosiga brevicollis MX1]|eukprot:XP_001744813.1 hypothetical protein [Monosiga brevicollis MX1]